MDNRNEIREFLVSRRARITPRQAGLHDYGGHRQVPGLRREEVAMLAGVSVCYYVRLECGLGHGPGRGPRRRHQSAGSVPPQYTEVPMGFASFFANITLTGGVAPARAYIEELLPDILEARIEPGRVFDRTVDLTVVPDGYQAMADRDALKVLVRP